MWCCTLFHSLSKGLAAHYSWHPFYFVGWKRDQKPQARSQWSAVCLRTARPEHGCLGMGNTESSWFICGASGHKHGAFKCVWHFFCGKCYAFLMWKAVDMAVWSSQKARQQNLFVMLTVLEEIWVVSVVPQAVRHFFGASPLCWDRCASCAENAPRLVRITPFPSIGLAERCWNRSAREVGGKHSH